MKIVIGEGSCGIAAGARKFREVFEKECPEIKAGVTGCIGMCKLEPIVEVYMPDDSKITYVKMTADKAVKVVNDTLVNGKVIDEYTVGAND